MTTSAQNCRAPTPANPDFPPWAYVRSTELAQLCGVSMQTVWNWRVRNQGPPSIQDRSRRHWYRLADVQSWLKKGDPAPDAIILNWIRTRFPGLRVERDQLPRVISYLEAHQLVQPVRKPKRLHVLKLTSPVKGGIPCP